MEYSKVIKIINNILVFDNGFDLYSEHEQVFCERHYLCFDDLTLSDFDDLEFDLTNDNFFERIDGYGIALLPINGHPVRIPGYGENNGEYAYDMDLILSDGKGFRKSYIITSCQDY